MSKSPFKVRSIEWGDSYEHTHPIEAYDEYDAVEIWCNACWSCGSFVDGYPENHEVEVMDAKGSVTRLIAETEMVPSFLVYDKETL